MWKSLGVGVAALMFLPACGVFIVRGDGHKATESRPLTGFSRVENRTSLDVVVREASSESVSLTLDENLLRYVTTRVSGDTLIIEIEDTESLSFAGEGRVVATLPRFLGAENEGSGSLLVEGITQVNALAFALDGSGEVRYCGPATSLTASLSGSGSMTLCTPTAQVLESVNLTVDGSGSLTYDGSAKRVEAVSSGSGGMYLTGLTTLLVARTSSSGALEARGLTSSEADVSVSGSGGVSATVNNGVTVRISGSGNVDLWGSATVRDVSLTGSGNLRRH
jgi:Putative auto-transporter adhesin, head GIN domain